MRTVDAEENQQQVFLRAPPVLGNHKQRDFHIPTASAVVEKWKAEISLPLSTLWFALSQTRNLRKEGAC
jgi:hypothetical protein